MGRSVWLAIPGSLLLLFFLIPLVTIFTRLEWSNLLRILTLPLVYESLRLSLATSLSSLVLTILLGIPFAYFLARSNFRGKKLVDSLIDLPMVMPPAVAGVALLMAFGRRGLIGQYLGLSISFSTIAVVLAQVFVASPFFIRAAYSSFKAVDPDMEKISLTLGVPPWKTFWRVTLPLSLPGLIGGAVMSWARALGEFGATVMFAGNLQGVTRTLPLAIYSAMERDLQAAMVMSAMMIVFSLGVLITARAVFKQR